MNINPICSINDIASMTVQNKPMKYLIYGCLQMIVI